MARYKIIRNTETNSYWEAQLIWVDSLIWNQGGQHVEQIIYTGYPTFTGSYLKPGMLEFREIASSAPIAWEVGDCVEYDRTGQVYQLFSVPQQNVKKQARSGSYGAAFVYSNVQFFDVTKVLELAPFRDLVPDGLVNVHFSTQPSIAVYDDVAGIAERIETCLNDYVSEVYDATGVDYGTWAVDVVSTTDPDLLATLQTELEYSVEGVSCLGALDRIYELWNNVGWTYSYANNTHTITIGGADVRTAGNTVPDLSYGKGNGLRTLERQVSGKDEMATRLYVYGSSRNMMSRYYNNVDTGTETIRNQQSVDIEHLMLPLANWGLTDGERDAAKAYVEDLNAIADYGLICRSVYFDGSEQEEIYPTLKGRTIDDLWDNMDPLDDYYPQDSIWAGSERLDAVAVGDTLSDAGYKAPLGQKYDHVEDFSTSAASGTKTIAAGSTTPVTIQLYSGSVTVGANTRWNITPEFTISGDIDDGDFTEASIRILLHGDTDIYWKIPLTKSLNETTGDYYYTIPKNGDFAEVFTTSTRVYVVTVSLYFNPVSSASSRTFSYDISAGTCTLGFQYKLNKTFTISIPQIGFDMSKYTALGEGVATVAMTTGACAGRSFLVKEVAFEQADDTWQLTMWRQNDSSLGTWFPNVNAHIAAGDNYVLLDIAMPDIYVEMAETRLLSAGQALLSRITNPVPVFTPEIDAKVIREWMDTNNTELTPLREGRWFHVSDADIDLLGTDYVLIDSVTIDEGGSNIPTYKVTMRDRKKVTIKQSVSASSGDMSSSVKGTDDTVSSSSDGGTLNYAELYNKPTINGTEISGAVSLADLGLNWFTEGVDSDGNPVLILNSRFAGLRSGGYITALDSGS